MIDVSYSKCQFDVSKFEARNPNLETNYKFEYSKNKSKT